MKSMILPLALAALILPQGALAEGAGPYLVTREEVTDWKAVYGRIEAKDLIPARARLGGTLIDLTAKEGDLVQAGQPLGKVVDEKIGFQINAIDAQLTSLAAQLANAQSELKRGQELKARGVLTTQQLDALQTQVDVYMGQIEAQKASRRVIEQQATEVADFIDMAPAPMVEPLPVEAPARASAQVAPPRRRGFASDVELAAWAMENPGELSPSQISVLQRCLSRPIARENLRANGIDTEALRTLLRAAAA